MNIKAFALWAATLGIASLVSAQEENTRERLVDQLKNGTAPGMVFSTARPVPAQASTIKINEKESLITQLRKGSATGFQFKAGSSSGIAQPLTMRASVAPAQPLASEKKIEKAAQVKVEAVVPTQE